MFSCLSTQDEFVGNKAKGRILTRVLKEKQSMPNFPTGAYQGVRNVLFSENLACSVFLVTLILRFAFLPYYQRIISYSKFKAS